MEENEGRNSSQFSYKRRPKAMVQVLDNLHSEFLLPLSSIHKKGFQKNEARGLQESEFGRDASILILREKITTGQVPRNGYRG